ncbi:MAG: phosphate propanoyltransferase [Oscillospiraceae bacterium]|jgi:putative phosphotransacetylase|nr:phosphate propanoyltransferase [Oscillospiraceae bacterium]
MMNEIVKVEVSARHVHLSEADFKVLFGSTAEIEVAQRLSLPQTFKATQRVVVEGPKARLEVAVVGPFKMETQVELSFSDAKTLGLEPPIRGSGDLQDSAPCKLIGPEGELAIESGVIVAKRHLHLSVDDSDRLGIERGDVVQVKVKTDGRSLTFGEVVVRVSHNFVKVMHIDTDEANAAGCFGNVFGEILIEEGNESK